MCLLQLYISTYGRGSDLVSASWNKGDTHPSHSLRSIIVYNSESSCSTEAYITIVAEIRIASVSEALRCGRAIVYWHISYCWRVKCRWLAWINECNWKLIAIVCLPVAEGRFDREIHSSFIWSTARAYSDCSSCRIQCYPTIGGRADSESALREWANRCLSPGANREW